MKYEKFVEWVFYGIIGGTAVTGVAILSRLNDSINTLNVQVATSIETNKWILREIDYLKVRLDKIEK